MRKNILSSLFPLAAVVALTGTGFGVWVFNNNNNVVETVTGHGHIVLTPAMELNNNVFEIKKVSVLNLDKTYNDMIQEIKFMLSINSFKGLNFTDELKNPITINFETTCTVLLPESLGNYIKLTYVDGNRGKEDNSDEEVKGTKQLESFNGPQNNITKKEPNNSDDNPFKFEVKFNGAFTVQASDFSENNENKEKEIKYNFGATYKYAWTTKPQNDNDYQTLNNLATNSTIDYVFKGLTFTL